MSRSTRRNEALLAFEALTIEGALLAPEWIAKIARLDAGGQAEADYRIPKGLNLRDEVSRSWHIARAYWSEFQSASPTQAVTEAFVLGLLRECFGFCTLQPHPAVTLHNQVYPIGFAARGSRVPVVIATGDIDDPSPAFGDGTRRRSPFGLAQEYLNASDDAQWGLACTGRALRLMRDNASLTRPAWIEVDLSRIFTEERYADFTVLFLLIHESRFGQGDQPASECLIETWRARGKEEGTRARDKLYEGVKDALLLLGNGFLQHKDNGALLGALQRGELNRQVFFGQLLRLIYRLIFLLVAEDRKLLHPEGTPETAQALYRDGYSLRHLREHAVRRSAHDRHHDRWDGLRIVFRALATGEPALGLPALDGLFAANQCPDLMGAKLANSALLGAIFRLSWLKEREGLVRVNWRDMETEELGSVYEGLLELVPAISLANRAFSFVEADESKGNTRKTTGSYYTPDSLVQILLDSALEPVVRARLAANPGQEAAALLRLTIVDPACGSGHFLLSAARRIAVYLARITSQGTPSAREYQRALREVVSHCIYGVDKNPMAVELCRVALWLEALEPGKPLTFLEAHVREGNALLGATTALMAGGVPDVAWEPLQDDDKKVARALKKRNSTGAQTQLGFGHHAQALPDVSPPDYDATDDGSLDALHQKRAAYQRWLVQSNGTRQLADLWCAAFLWPKQPGPLEAAAPTQHLWLQVRTNPARIPPATAAEVTRLREQYQFFHWEVEFPNIFADGGFDVVLGNPPWERVKLQEQEFFASRSDTIAQAPNAAARKRLITALPATNPALWIEWSAALREAEGQSFFVRQSGRYPLCGKGDVNTYALFAEHNRNILGGQGRAGFIVPPGLATDDTTKAYFQSLTAGAALASLYEFENEEFLFPGIDHRVRFIVITVTGKTGLQKPADICFGVRNTAQLADPTRHFSLSPADFAALNPNTRTCPTFRSRRDADINLALYRRAGILWREDDPNGNPWGLRFLRMLDMANDSGLFRTRAELDAAGWALRGNHFYQGEKELLPLFEAKMVHHFDHRFGTYLGQTEAQAKQGILPRLDDTQRADPEQLTLPEYWVDAQEVESRLEERWDRGWFLGWRDICRSTDQRTVIASLIPRIATGDTFLLMFPSHEPRLIACLYANLCSFALDYAARQKVGGTHLKYHTFKQLPILPPSSFASWHLCGSPLDFLLPRILELTYTAHDLQPFAQDCDYHGPPFVWNPARRATLRAEIDAAFFHLYQLSRDDTAYILDTFPIVRKNDEATYGEYRTKRLILEAYDALGAGTAIPLKSHHYPHLPSH